MTAMLRLQELEGRNFSGMRVTDDVQRLLRSDDELAAASSAGGSLDLHHVGGEARV